ncbi:MAG: NUDIX hydrolase [Deltaproteobacteria bacterium]|nr:NUDIX hydrolase [Deltaproteobacteria bacterium]
MSREYPARPITAVGGLIFKGEEALLVRRAKDPGRGQWSIPGGAIKVGETLLQALSREMREETNLDVETGPLVAAVERIVRDPEGKVMFHYIILDYLCFAPRDEPRPGSDVSVVRFVSADNWPGFGLDQLALDTLHKALDMIRN